MPRFSRLTVEKNRLGTAEAEREILKAQLAAAEKRGHGLRAAYECLLEALIQATIKIAVTEAEVKRSKVSHRHSSPRKRNHLKWFYNRVSGA
jgi:hypothetical protein